MLSKIPIKNRSIHLEDLIVDGDIRALKNIVANGEVSAGGTSV